MQPLTPLDTTDLFRPLSRELLAVLRSLRPEEWARPTACAPWTVKDVAAHLLGGSLGRLWDRAQSADGPAFPPQSYAALVDLINHHNALWVQAAQRISPEILIDFLEVTDERLADYFQTLPPAAPAPITVAWASDDPAPNWFDIAREYTEKWLHQQHIREAVQRPLLTERVWLAPVLNAFMRGLPRAFRHTAAAPGAGVAIVVTGAAGGEWALVRAGAAWDLYEGAVPQAVSRVELDQDTAWRLFTKGVSPAAARPRVQVTGDLTVGETVLQTVSIMA